MNFGNFKGQDQDNARNQMQKLLYDQGYSKSKAYNKRYKKKSPRTNNNNIGQEQSTGAGTIDNLKETINSYESKVANPVKIKNIIIRDLGSQDGNSDIKTKPIETFIYPNTNLRKTYDFGNIVRMDLNQEMINKDKAYNDEILIKSQYCNKKPMEQQVEGKPIVIGCNKPNDKEIKYGMRASKIKIIELEPSKDDQFKNNNNNTQYNIDKNKGIDRNKPNNIEFPKKRHNKFPKKYANLRQSDIGYISKPNQYNDQVDNKAQNNQGCHHILVEEKKDVESNDFCIKNDNNWDDDEIQVPKIELSNRKDLHDQQQKPFQKSFRKKKPGQDNQSQISYKKDTPRQDNKRNNNQKENSSLTGRSNGSGRDGSNLNINHQNNKNKDKKEFSGKDKFKSPRMQFKKTSPRNLNRKKSDNISNDESGVPDKDKKLIRYQNLDIDALLDYESDNNDSISTKNEEEDEKYENLDLIPKKQNIKKKPKTVNELIEGLIFNSKVIKEHERKIDAIVSNINESGLKPTLDKEIMNSYREKEKEYEAQKSEFLKAMNCFKKRVEEIETLLKGPLEISDPNSQDIIKSIVVEINRLNNPLPIYAKKSKIIEIVEKNQFMILVGETGSGKSTQMIQYLLESDQLNQKKIISTQPRKIATISVATRVAEELETKLGDIVDYQVSQFKDPSLNAKLIFKIDRLLINELLEDPVLSKYSCIIVDEAHERNINTDILLGMLKKATLMRKDLRVVVTSATLDEDLFIKYFKCDLIKVPGQLFPVKIKYIPPNENSTYITEIFNLFKKKIESVKWGPNGKHNGHILVFTSGVDEIYTLIKRIGGIANKRDFELLPLHGKLTSKEQNLIFKEIAKKVKIIFTTRIAETSVTINNIGIVIDIGIDREQVYDPIKRMTVMEVRNISQSAAKQRSGRAGRTREGVCYRIYSEDFFDQLNLSKTPEILRMNMDHTILKLKQLQVKNVLKFDFIQRPQDNVMENSIENLIMLGALKFDPETKDHILTPIGEKLALLPIEPTLGRILLEAENKGCIIEIAKIISVMVNSMNLFTRGTNDDMKENADLNKFDFCNPSGDFLTFLKIFNHWSQLPQGHSSKEWCNKNYLNNKSLKQAQELFDEILHSITGLRNRNNAIIREEEKKNQEIQEEEKEEEEQNLEFNILKCMLTGFFQNICLYSGNARLGYTFIRHMEVIQIHGSSSLSLQCYNPKWIICTEIVKNAYLAAKICSAVDLNWIKQMVPIEYQKLYKIDEINKEPIYNMVKYEKVGTTLLHLFARKTEDRILKVIESQKVFFDSNVKLETIEAYCIKPISEFKPKVDELIKSLTDEFVDEIFEYQIKGNTRIVVKGGAEISEILLGQEFKTLNFRNINLENYESLMNLCKLYGEIERFRVKQNEKSMLYEGSITMVNKNIAAEIEKIFTGDNETFESKIYRFHATQDAKPIKGRIKFTWIIGISECTGEVIYEDPFDAQNAISNMFGSIIDNKNISCNLSRKDKTKTKIIVRQLSPLTDETELENHFKLYGSAGKILRTSIFRSEDLSLPKEDENQTKNKIQEILNKIGIPSEDIVNIQAKFYKNSDRKNNIRRKAFISFTNPAHVMLAKDKLDGQINILGNQKVYIEPHFTRTHRFANIKKFHPIEKQLYPLIDDLKNQFDENQAKIMLGGNPYKWNPTYDDLPYIKVVATEPQVLNYIQEILNGLILPKYFEFKNVYTFKKIDSKPGFNFCRDLEKKYSCYIETNRRFKRLDIYASPEMYDIIKEDIKKYLEIDSPDQIRISFRGKYVRSLLQNKARLFKEIQSQYLSRNVEVDFSLLRKEIYIYGPKSILPEIEKEFEEILDSGSNKSNSDNLDNLENECPICTDDSGDFYRLQLCRHRFCLNCLQILIGEASNDISAIPILCPTDNCRKKIALKDIRDIIQFDILKKLFNSSYNSFIQKNNKLYKTCQTPNCKQIYSLNATSDHFECDSCFKSYCRKCGKEYHENLTCEQYASSNREDLLLSKVLKKEGYKKCPKCAFSVEKLDGCNHMACPCGCHFCWLCLAGFTKKEDCYTHLERVHNGIYRENDGFQMVNH